MKSENNNELKNFLAGFPIRPVLSKDDYQFIHSVKLLVNGQQILPAILKSISRAKSSILFQVMLFHPDSIGKRISTELINAAHRGVEVRLLFNQEMSVSGSIAGRYPPNIRRKFKVSLLELKNQWRRSGIEFIDNQAGLPTRPFKKKSNRENLERDLRRHIQINANHVDHRKLIVFDGAQAIVGGANVGEQYLYFDPPNFDQNMLEGAKSGNKNSKLEFWEKWLDIALSFRGGLMPALIEEFRFRWEMMGGEHFELSFANSDEKGIKASVLIQRPGYHEIASEILKVFNSAQEKINIVCPFVSHPEFINALCQASSKGVEVNFVYPAEYNEMQLSRRIIEYYSEELFESGINIYENKERMIHTKIITVDSKLAIIGSANLNYRSAIHDFELNLKIKNKAFAREINQRVFKNYFEEAELLLMPKRERLALLDRAILLFS